MHAKSRQWGRTAGEPSTRKTEPNAATRDGDARPLGDSFGWRNWKKWSQITRLIHSRVRKCVLILINCSVNILTNARMVLTKGSRLSSLSFYVLLPLPQMLNQSPPPAPPPPLLVMIMRTWISKDLRQLYHHTPTECPSHSVITVVMMMLAASLGAPIAPQAASNMLTPTPPNPASLQIK